LYRSEEKRNYVVDDVERNVKKQTLFFAEDETMIG
jgi:hypothetical protein